LGYTTINGTDLKSSRFVVLFDLSELGLGTRDQQDHAWICDLQTRSWPEAGFYKISLRKPSSGKFRQIGTGNTFGCGAVALIDRVANLGSWKASFVCVTKWNPHNFAELAGTEQRVLNCDWITD
jgi:hypothetical protein